MNKKYTDVFDQYPNAKTLFEDSNGNVWLNEKTAKSQSKDGKIKTIKKETSKPEKNNNQK